MVSTNLRAAFGEAIHDGDIISGSRYLRLPAGFSAADRGKSTM